MLMNLLLCRFFLVLVDQSFLGLHLFSLHLLSSLLFFFRFFPLLYRLGFLLVDEPFLGVLLFGVLLFGLHLSLLNLFGLYLLRWDDL